MIEKTHVETMGIRPTESSEPCFILVNSSNPDAIGTIFRVRSEEAFIGRDPVNSISIEDGSISRKHAKILHDEDGGYRIVDLDSTNGTYLNRTRVGAATLSEGDRIQLGTATTLRFSFFAQLADSEQQLRQALAASKTGTWEWSVHSSRLTWGDKVEALLGLEPGSDPAESLPCVHPEDRALLAEALETASANGTPCETEFRIISRFGAPRWVAVRGDVFRNERKAPDRIAGTVTDITERKLAEEEDRKVLMADRMSSLGTLAAGIAHEINTPLAYVLANLSFIAEELDEILPRNTPSRELIAAIKDTQDGAARIKGIVQGIRTLSRDDEKLCAVDVPAALEVAATIAGAELRSRARVVKNYGEVPRVKANEARLVQVFLNLLLNAAQAITRGKPDTNEIKLTCGMGQDGRVVVEITDTGMGIAPEVRSRIFDPFFTTKAVGQGTGLGLSISYSIISSFGGEIECEPGSRGGTCFRISLLDSDALLELPRLVHGRPSASPADSSRRAAGGAPR